MTIKRIVVATDGSKTARQAMKWSAEVAGSLNAEITALYAVGRTYHPAQMASAMYVPVDYNAMLKNANEILATEWCRPLRDAQVKFRAMVRDGAPAEMILLTALEEKADLIVMGSRGHGGFAELLMGSVAHHVSHHARVPVVVVPPSAVPEVQKPAELQLFSSETHEA
jgi:nucleotide-binding universal stress UspA family protein